MFLLPVAMFLQVVVISVIPVQSAFAGPIEVSTPSVKKPVNNPAKLTQPTRPKKIPTTKTYTASITPKAVPTQFNFLDIIPRVKAYEVPGEKHLMVLSLKCPTELLDVTTPSSAVIHSTIDTGFGIANKMPFLPYTFQQVCN